MSTVQKGQTVEVHYIGTFDDGTEFDSSRERGEAISFEVGSGQMIQGFEDAVTDMTVGEIKDVRIESSNAYGAHKEEFIQTYPKNVFPENVELKENATVAGQNQLGQPMIAKIVELKNDEVILDFNHPMAGKDLNFNLELISVT